MHSIKKILPLFLLFFSFLLHGEEVVVSLRTNEAHPPVYISPLQAESSSFPQEYLSKLNAILSNDFALSGRARLLKQTKEREKITLKEKSWKGFDQHRWIAEGAFGVIKGVVAGKHLSLSALKVKTDQIRGIEGIELTGDLNIDRTKIHALSDQLISALFDVKGIASSRILYTVTKKTPGAPSHLWKTDVWECDSDGANAKMITHSGHLCVTPSYIPSPSATRAKAFLYVSYAIGQPKLFAGSLHNGKEKRITYLPGNQITPAISPKGDLIAFTGDASGNPELYILPFSLEKGALEKPRLIFSSLTGAQGCPAFNPQGDKLTFVSNKDGKPRIYLMSIPKSGRGQPVMLTKKNSNNTSPSWSPDGSKLAYTAWNGGTREIWIYDFQTKKEWQLTSGKEHKENPAWAPNSFHLVYNTSSQESSELYLVNLADPTPIKISTGVGEKRFPSFSP